MTPYICRTCAVQYAPSEEPPERCIICEDERQYIGWSGQQWTTLAELRDAGHSIELREHEPGLLGVGVRPHFGIGQRALLVQTPNGNALWDCVGYIEEEAAARIGELGGVQAISASHPHFYGAMAEWSRAFGGAPIYLPEADRQWVTRPDGAIEFWSGAREVLPGVTLVQCGGHFQGSAVLHWAEGADGRGALLTGDSIAVVQDRRFVSFMWSYPNLIPLSAETVQRVIEAVRPYAFDRIYGGWWHSVVSEDAKEGVERSAERYVRRITH